MRFICETCGVETADAPEAPAECAICSDERQYVGPSGQRWTTMEAILEEHSVAIEDDAGLLALRIRPPFAIDQRALLIPTDRGNILWECISAVSEEAVAELERRGGVSLIVISHPHFYSAMASWSDALGGAPVLLHESDRQWIQGRPADLQFWNGDVHVLSPDVTLIRSGGHFAGSTMLHWKGGPRAGGALFAGDTPQVTADRRHLGFMYSYPNYIPMHPDEVRAIQRRLAPYRFEDVFGYSYGRNIRGAAHRALDKSVARYLRAVGSKEEA